MDVLLEVKELKKYFKTPKGMLHAVDGISFQLERGQTLGVVGESGCGKSTLGRTILHLLDNSGGQILFNGNDITNITKTQFKNLRRNMQIVFQDPFSSLNPRMTVSCIISEPLRIYKIFQTKKEVDEKVEELMDIVGLSRRLSDSYPHELDGGRRQRIGIARALALNPEFIVCDEPVSSLDVSIQAQILNLMQDLQEERKLTYLFITHDLSVVKHISNHILVMYLGNMVEYAETDELFDRQMHPYTKALLAAVPIPDVEVEERSQRVLLKGEISSPVDPRPGCRFAPRCEYAEERCFHETPQLQEPVQGHFVLCHKPLL